MAKPKKTAQATKRTKPSELPVCVAMLVCEKVIVAEDKSASLIRIVDSLFISPEAASAPNGQIEIHGVSLFIALKETKNSPVINLASVDPKGKRTIMGMLTPSGETSAHGGANTISPFRIWWDGPGLYWLELFGPKETIIAKTPVQIGLIGDPGSNTNQ